MVLNPEGFGIINEAAGSQTQKGSEPEVGLPGFEPESIEPKSTSLDQASREPHYFAD